MKNFDTLLKEVGVPKSKKTEDELQIDEATLAHKGFVYLKDGELDEAWVTIVHKSDGPAPNIELSIKKKGSKDVEHEFNMTSGRFGKGDINFLSNMFKIGRSTLDKVESAFYDLSRMDGLDDKKVLAVLKKAGITRVAVK